MIAKSFGLRASNSSATRGRPPVMSRVFDDSRGMRASTSPALTEAPLSIERIATAGSRELAARHRHALVGEQPRAVRHAVPRLLAAGFIDHDKLAIAAHHDRQARRVDHDVAVLDLHGAVERRLDRGLLGAALGRTADVEG